MAHKFNVGDKLFVRSNSEIQIEVTDVIIEDGITSYKVNYIAVPDDKNYLYGYSGMLFSKEHIEKDCELLSKGVNTSDTPPEFKKQCSCESHILFTKGCKCGSIKPYQLNWG